MSTSTCRSDLLELRPSFAQDWSEFEFDGGVIRIGHHSHSNPTETPTFLNLLNLQENLRNSARRGTTPPKIEYLRFTSSLQSLEPCVSVDQRTRKEANTQESGGPAPHSTTETQILTPIKPAIATNVTLHSAKLASHPQRYQYLAVAEARLLFKSGLTPVLAHFDSAFGIGRQSNMSSCATGAMRPLASGHLGA
jgi:hypothetical protein